MSWMLRNWVRINFCRSTSTRLGAERGFRCQACAFPQRVTDCALVAPLSHATRCSLQRVSFSSLENASWLWVLSWACACWFTTWGNINCDPALQQTQQTLPNQLGKATQRNVGRWIFQCLIAVHLVVLNGVKQVINLTDERHSILQFFNLRCKQYYLLLWDFHKLLCASWKYAMSYIISHIGKEAETFYGRSLLWCNFWRFKD